MHLESTANSTELFQTTFKNSKEKLVTDNMEMASKLAWKLLNSWQAKLPQDDVKSLVGISLCEAANNFDGRPGVQFQTFLYYYLRGRLLREITKSVKAKSISKTLSNYDNHSNFKNEDPAINDIRNNHAYSELKTAEEILIEQEQQDVLQDAFKSLDKLEREIVQRHYINGDALIDLAKELGYCRCHLSRVKRRALSKLKNTMIDAFEKNAENLKESYTGGRGRRKIQLKSKTLNSPKALAA